MPKHEKTKSWTALVCCAIPEAEGAEQVSPFGDIAVM
jgi:hypothetical protein